MTAVLAASLLAACATPQAPVLAEPMAVVAAGSLREALTEVAQAYETRTGQKLALSFAVSGLLRERIEKGEAAQVFASADMGHPQKLFEKADGLHLGCLCATNCVPSRKPI